MVKYMRYTTTCELCGKEYDNYHCTFYIQEENGNKIKVCMRCRKSYCENKKYTFMNHIPNFFDGGVCTTICFNTEEELLKYIEDNTKENYIVCMADDGDIIDVSKQGKGWWVRGYSTLTPGKLPNWRGVAKLYHEDEDL
jgi:hypothetical protein